MAAEKEKQKEVETVEHAQCVADDALNRDFAGRLMSYKKDNLQALAIALSISNKGTNSGLLSHIEDCFKTNTKLKNNSRFSGLFSKQHKLEVTSDQEDTPNQGGSQSQQQLPHTPATWTASTITVSHDSHFPPTGPSPSPSHLHWRLRLFHHHIFTPLRKSIIYTILTCHLGQSHILTPAAIYFMQGHSNTIFLNHTPLPVHTSIHKLQVNEIIVLSI